MDSLITVGVSACLTGEKVRYDGGHRLDRYLTETLGQLFRLLPVCPEVGSGLSTPREPMRLEAIRPGPGWSPSKAASTSPTGCAPFAAGGSRHWSRRNSAASFSRRTLPPPGCTGSRY